MEDPQQVSDELIIETVRTRCGYPLQDVLKEFKYNLEQSGSTHAAKCMHYTADLLCSGCLQIWKRFLWDYLCDHVGIGSPRAFLFLQKQFFTLDSHWNRYSCEKCISDPAFQKLCMECILILRSCQRKPQIKLPRVPVESHSDEWISRSTGSAPSSMAVSKVFKGSYDLAVLKTVGEEFCKSIIDGATQRALFWMKWAFEEDSRLKKQHSGHGLTNLERGPSTVSPKQRTHIGYFFVYVLAEVYKELFQKGLIRMTEEFQALLNLYITPESAMTTKRRNEILVLSIQILCEAPRWKVPAAPGLVQDPNQFKRALEHSEHFFREVLTFEAPRTDLEQEAKKIKQKVTESKKLDLKKQKEKSLSGHLDAYDKILADYMGF
jgi:hypothetical protein